MTAAAGIITAPGQARRDGASAAQWLGGATASVHHALAGRGAALVRGLPVRSAADVAALRDRLIAAPTVPTELFAPRQDHGSRVFSPMRWPRDRMLCPSHEQSYSLEFPGLVLLACLTPCTAGGQTLLSDSRETLARLPAGLADRFRRHGWLMVRTFRPGLGISWQDAFGCQDTDELERKCAAGRISLEWLPGGELRASRLRPAVVRHPVTGNPCWFSDAAFYSEWALPSDERDVLTAAFGASGLPVNTYLGDGSPLAPGEVRTLEAAREAVTVPVSWQAGDLLLLDNILLAHGRQPYSGRREILVSMGDPVRLDDCAPVL